MKPFEIEAESFRIIDSEAGPHPFPPEEWPIVRRIVHTAADFDFIGSTVFSAGAVAAGLAALLRGEAVYCDTEMVRAGIGKARLAGHGSPLYCHIAEAEVAETALREGTTRSAVAVRKGVAQRCGIYLIGNAPTALFELLRLVAEGSARPSLVIGVPVGFVGAAEAKEALLASGLPCISCRGRKGGSAIAAAALNALLILAEEKGR